MPTPPADHDPEPYEQQHVDLDGPTRLLRWQDHRPILTAETGECVRIEAAHPFSLHIGVNGWNDIEDIDADPIPGGIYGVVLYVLAGFRSFEFTRRWADGTWEQIDHHIVLRRRTVANECERPDRPDVPRSRCRHRSAA